MKIQVNTDQKPKKQNKPKKKGRHPKKKTKLSRKPKKSPKLKNKKQPQKKSVAKVAKKETLGKASDRSVSQLRQDLISGDWVVIAATRGRRPFNADKIRAAWDPDEIPDEAECLFCDPVASKQEKDVLIYNTADGDWTLRVFPNKYPAFARPKGKIQHQEEGPYFWMDGVGYHEVIVTRDHHRHIGQMEPMMVAEVLDAYQTRYLDLMNKKSVRYVDIFHNHGPEAGASVYHPHSQLAAIPVISPYIKLELDGAKQYKKSNRKCVYCDMLEWEKEREERIVFENDSFVAFCPFASRAAFEIWVMPKKHKPYFERSNNEEKVDCGQALHEAVRRFCQVLGEPAYNFYLHTSPCDGRDYPYYHWHIEILPKTSIWAGFELSTGIEISTIEPEKAAKLLREIT